ncbi:BnaA01g25410D [Brassica napus]|uniref:BnaA01g25410D protein n=1 Tax=Brassica napus TaxID=3708 RepID=A0A078HHU4_BRANA|nr:BnaA01g25410D [Brassica napus]
MTAASFSEGFDYETWALTTKATLTEQGLWDVVENGVPPDPSKIPEVSATIKSQELSQWRDLVIKDMNALQVMQSSLTDSAFKKTLSASSSKDVWDMLKKSNEQARLSSRLEEEEVHEYLIYDEDMWMICAKGTTNHMSRYEKHFSVLDRTHKGKVRLADGTFLRVEGRGHVRIMMKEGKKTKTKTMRDVIFVPGLNVNVLSIDLMIARGYSLESKRDTCVFFDRKGAVFGDAVMDKKGPALRLNMIEGTQEEEIAVDYVMAAVISKTDLVYDEDMWMVSGFSTIHMTPYENVFKALDRTHKGKVGLKDGTVLKAEGKGDVEIVMKGGKKKKTIKNVLFVPEIMRNVLSFSQMETYGCSFREGRGGECIISDETGAVYGDTTWDVKDMALRLEVIKGNRTS